MKSLLIFFLNIVSKSPRKRLQRFLGNKTMLRISFQSGLEPRLKRRSPPTFATLRGGGYLLFCYISYLDNPVQYHMQHDRISHVRQGTVLCLMHIPKKQITFLYHPDKWKVIVLYPFYCSPDKMQVLHP